MSEKVDNRTYDHSASHTVGNLGFANVTIMRK